MLTPVESLFSRPPYKAIVAEAHRSALECVTFRRTLLALAPGQRLLAPTAFDAMMELMSRFKFQTKLPKMHSTCRAISQCSCPAGQKAGCCACALVHSVWVGGVEVPEQYKVGVNPIKKGPGRKRKTVGALQFQQEPEQQNPIDCPAGQFSPLKKKNLGRRVSM